MNHFKPGTLALLLATTLFATPGFAAPPTAQCKADGQDALAALTQGKFKQATMHFSPDAASHVSPEVLQTSWQQLLSQLGAFKSLGRLAPLQLDGNDMLATTMTFADGKLGALVACDADNRIGTFRLVPAASLDAAAKPATGSKPPPDIAAMQALKADLVARQRAPHPPVKARVEADGVRVQPLAVPSPVGSLRGALTLPAGQGPFPAVVLVAGSGPNDLDETVGPNKPFRDIADGLAKLGVASLRYDKRTFAHGAKAAAQPRFTVDDEVTDDALAAARLLAQQKSVDSRRVFVLGHSEGAMLAPRIVQRDPQLAGAIMLAAPARPLLEVSRQQTRDLAAKLGASPDQIAAALRANEVEQALLDKADPRHPPAGEYGGVPQSFWLSLHDYRQAAVAKSLPQPLLILQGGSDFQVSSTLDFDKWKQALAGKPNATFHLYPGFSHLFRPVGETGTLADYLKPGPVAPRVIDDIANWIKAQPSK